MPARRLASNTLVPGVTSTTTVRIADAQIIGILDAYAWPSIGGTILFNRVLVPRFLGGTPDEAAIAAALPRAHLCLAEIDRADGG
jgi:hypothetical protein